MKNFIFHGIVVTIILFGFSCNRIDNVEPDRSFLTNRLTANVADLTRKGAYDVCEEYYEVPQKGKQGYKGQAYFPKKNTSGFKTSAGSQPTCMPASGKFPVVFLVHPDGGHGFSDDFKLLGPHLASHGYAVFSINRIITGETDYEIFDNVLKEHINYLYGSSKWAGHIKDEVSILGQSAGGRATLGHHGVIEAQGKDLKAVILIAPTQDVDKMYPIAQANALLCLLSADDNDVFGDKIPNTWMKTISRIHEQADQGLVRHMIFRNIGGHYFQNDKFTKAYVTAFLNAYMLGNPSYESYFNHQKKMPNFFYRKNMNEPIQLVEYLHRHSEPNDLMLANFENGNTKINSQGGAVQKSWGAIEFDIQNAWVDQYSPHGTKIAKVVWDKTASQDQMAATFLKFDLKDTNLNKYKYLSFSASQIYHPTENPTGDETLFELILQSGNSSKKISLKENGSLLPFPWVMEALSTKYGVKNVTKNQMRDFLIPLSTFEGVDLNNVESVTFSFDHPDFDKGKIYLDDIKFVN